jgi:hypothetical protein
MICRNHDLGEAQIMLASGNHETRMRRALFRAKPESLILISKALPKVNLCPAHDSPKAKHAFGEAEIMMGSG